MKDLKNVPRAQEILLAIARYQTIEKDNSKSWSEVRITTSDSNLNRNAGADDSILISPVNLGRAEMVLLRETFVGSIKQRIAELNAELESL